MRTFPFLQVDAFTTQPLAGNACAVVLDADDLEAATMQAIAREQNLSETAFVRRSRSCDFGVRYFTPAEEIPLAGHPTIATAWALVDCGRLQLQGPRTRTTFELQVGPIEVEVVSGPSGPEHVVMSQKKPVFLAPYEAAEVMPIFGLRSEDLLPGFPIQTVSTGLQQLMVPVRDLEVLRRIALDVPAYVELRRRSDFFSTHLFCLQGATAAGRTFARHFVVPPDLIEDPFTGSATGGMAAYLWHHGCIETPTFIAEQGHWLQRPGQATVEVVGPRHDITTVKVGGPAVTVIRGTMELPEG